MKGLLTRILASSRTKIAGNASSTPQPHAAGDTPSSAAPGGAWAPRQHRASVSRKVSARPSVHPSSTSLQSLSSQLSSLKTDSPAQDEGEDHEDGEEPSSKTGENHDAHGALIAQVFEWLNQEKAKRAAKKVHDTTSSVYHDLVPNRSPGPNLTRERSSSQSSEKAMALDKLERILSQFSATSHSSASSLRRKRSAFRSYRRGSASDSDYSDSEQAVPSVDATLDNSKTMAYTGGLPETETTTIPLSKQRSKDRENWNNFKSEIVRFAHTLRLKGWRRVPIDSCGDLEVVRLSGALTNAVYVVTPPKNLPAGKNAGSLTPKRPPPKLLLRIYGPQVEHLIDRDNELQILRRLGKKNIGPRVLGTFNNGRFEEYFHARTLTPKDMRNPDTSKQIAKRMRELHDGIELLEEERNGGPFIWKNWDKWVDRCEQIITWLDKEIMSSQSDSDPPGEPWMKRGFVCGVPWPQFRKMVDSYRKWLHASYGGTEAIRNQLVFAHNDTQYGNLLRLEPSGESPLLLPANEHKQLVVIDFEYSSANLRGLEFANHFTEWCYNYHDAERPYACNPKAYPTPDEQRRFIKAYINHRPQGLAPAGSELHPPPSGGPSSANMLGRTNTQGSNPAGISTPRLAPLSLDSNSELSIPDLEAEQLREQSTEADVQKLMQEARLWRFANSAQWVAWGIVQAKVPRMEREMAAAEQEQHGDTSTNGSAKEPGALENGKKDNETTDARSESSSDTDFEEEDGFDYLAYAQERALFFWADALSLGFIDEKELPDGMLDAIKPRVINY